MHFAVDHLGKNQLISGIYGTSFNLHLVLLYIYVNVPDVKRVIHIAVLYTMED